MIRHALSLTAVLLALLLVAPGAGAAPGDPFVVYTANSRTTGAVILRTDPATGSVVEISRNGAQGTLFRTPFDLAVEASGNLVVADMGEPDARDGSIVRVDPLTGVQSLVSSGGSFFDPAGIAVAPSGDLYVADNAAPDGDGAVIRVDPRTGAQAVVARNGPGETVLDLPFGIAVERAGSLVVANRVTKGQLPASCPATGRIVRVDPATGAKTVLGAAPGRLSFPLGVALDGDGSILVANECENADGVVRLRQSGSTWIQSTLTPNGGGDLLRTPERVALDPAGALLVSDFNLGADGDGGIARVDPTTGAQSLVASGDLFNHPLGIAAVVNRPPTAALVSDAALVAAGRPVHFDGGGSGDPDGLPLVYEWDLDGDGAFEAGSGTTATASRTWQREGLATVRVRVNDPHGGRAVAETGVTIDGSNPVVTRLRTDARVLGVGRPRKRGRATRRRPPRATRVRFQLSEPAQVSLGVERARAGRKRRGGACRPRARRGRRCVVWRRARLIGHSGQAGANAIRLRARGLRPGRFRLAVSAVDRVGHRSARRTLPLRVVRLRR